jgi:hypothetical protein
MTSGHRSVAQNGQYSAPMYRISGLPFATNAVPRIGSGGAVALPGPTRSNTLAGIERSAATSAADAGARSFK